ncbi:phosphonate transport system permease protein [Homoserinimonas aerilata]|uniref:Phosphonate transport system permease protein n=1 Tax=Homoserinimonas aerilata TaxID=1162970 RepID=A0A542YJ21_9MICO|nr:ABC transporter permease subunit [Homoserinimonas aerilata]TQL48095.1 phosphonate transport system permease protein [Homoserinimonas aerilata]
MTTLLAPPTKPEFEKRVESVERPRPRVSTIVSAATLIGIAVLGVVSFIRLDYSVKNIETTWSNITRFVGMATPMQWPGWDVTAVVGSGGTKIFTTEWVGFEPIWQMGEVILLTLALTIAGTALAVLLSIPVAYGAAANTTPNSTVRLLCRGLGVVARAIPDAAMAVFLIFLWFGSGILPAIVAIALHSVGMISKMFADAIEQVDEGPRNAIRSAGGSRSQQFWSGIFPQVLPAWIAVGLHRADINLRGTVILGYVGVAGIGAELNGAMHAGAAGMRRVIPLVVIIILLCIVFEIVSSSIRARLLNVQPTGKGLGDTIIRNSMKAAAKVAATASSNHAARIDAAMDRPWDRDRRTTMIWIWSGIIVVAASFLYLQPEFSRMFSGWRFDQVHNEGLDRAVWPFNFGDKPVADVLDAALVTIEVALAATLMGAVISAIVGPLSARNVAPNAFTRNFFRGVALVIRAIPDLVVAILFIIATGFGPQAATLALGIGGVGLLAKLIGDSMEEVDPGPEKALTAAGASRPQRFFSSTVPMSIPTLVSHVLYLLEQNIRSATVLGIVGGGGIGFLLLNAMNGRHFDHMFAYLLVIIAMVVVVEAAAMLIRRALK